jgi:hypothetical protein
MLNGNRAARFTKARGIKLEERGVRSGAEGPNRDRDKKWGAAVVN